MAGIGPRSRRPPEAPGVSSRAARSPTPRAVSHALALLATLAPLAASTAAATLLPAERRGGAARADAELVLQDHSRLEVETSEGHVAVSAGQGLARTYEWEGCRLAADMAARRKRWFGSLGAYDPAGRFGPADTLRDKLRACRGISRTVVEEGQLHFPSVEAAMEWVRRYARAGRTAWNGAGVVAQWRIVPSRDQFNFSLWRLCVDGRPATGLEGARDSAVRIAQGGLRECARVDPAVAAATVETWRKHWEEAARPRGR